jgi:hypothetical protein
MSESEELSDSDEWYLFLFLLSFEDLLSFPFLRVSRLLPSQAPSFPVFDLFAFFPSENMNIQMKGLIIY